MMGWIALGMLVMLVTAGTPVSANAEPISFKLLPNYSRATFKSDAPLETFVGNTAGAGIVGTLAVDPARPQAAAGTVRVDLTTIRTGVEKRDADMRVPQLLFLKVSNDIQLETDLTFARQ